ncbi:5-formyltetrahydrofolate cyclo-ligase [Sutterella sp.]|uniref:5-formyltetrahydrofolate cyclo-ligase n=1 Tax=Sutterella sp. TaxID=1981025 RepID=UPI0026E01F3A|nr:5-formyltetrahydrofolate cyclo-ligase [Sutterella sp.]MDO5532132.1 5-formyltetrahydrofolate cyclo-ligase [Sutterella sp.]
MVLAEEKRRVRREMGALRREAGLTREGALLEVLARRLEADADIRVLGIYQPIRSEPDAGAVFAKWCGASPARSLALPWCLNRDASEMEYRLWLPGEALRPDAAGIPAPAGAQVVPDALVIPCLGWSRTRKRLGYGGGYFDRYIARLAASGSRPRLIGVAYRICEVEESLFEAHDLPLDEIVTDEGVF